MESNAAPVEIPAELQQARPRRVRLSGAGRALAGLIVLLFAGAPTAAILMSRATINQREAALQLETHSAVTNATVTQLRRESKESNRASVYYTFMAEGRSHSARAKVPMAQWRALRVGSSLPVRYVVGNADENIPDGVTLRVLPSWLAYFVAAVTFGIGFLCYTVLKAERRLLEDGRVATATVRAHMINRSQHGTHRSMRYDFATLSGVRVTGKSPTSNKPPAVGSGIVIVYDSESPNRNKPYPFQLVRLEVL